MPRRARVAPGGLIYHVLNRANGRDILFDSPASYRDFLRIVSECAEASGMRILAYCIMPNHWHMLLWPRDEGDLFRFVHSLSIRHAKRLHLRNGTTGRGHIYQARYKSFVVQDDEHLLTVCLYIELNPARARLVSHPADWPWSSAASRRNAKNSPHASLVELEALPVAIPPDWAEAADQRQEDLEKIRVSVVQNAPFGEKEWARRTADQTGLPAERRKPGRPRNQVATMADPQR